MPARSLCLIVASLAGCAPASEGPDAGATPSGLGVLGSGAHTLDAVTMTVISADDDGLNGPRDLDFNPERPGELWVVNRVDDSVVVYTDVGTDSQAAQRFKDPYALHFMEEVSSISFGTGMKFGTCQESRNTYDDQAAPNDFMGPALWSADTDVFAQSNQDAVDELGFDLGSHLDMLHESPLCMGIAWAGANVYFTFDGLTGSISRYDFQEDHGPGFDDHSDGIIERFADVGVERVEDVPSHMVFDHDSGLLYVADTGNARIAVLDPTTASDEGPLPVFEQGTTLTELTGATMTTLVDAAAGELEAPSGLALRDDVLYVADNATGRISAFSLAGERIDWLDTELPGGALMGIRVDTDGRLFAVDFADDRVLMFTAKD